MEDWRRAREEDLGGMGCSEDGKKRSEKDYTGKIGFTNFTLVFTRLGKTLRIAGLHAEACLERKDSGAALDTTRPMA